MFEIPEKFEFLRNRIEKTLKPTNEIKYISCKTKPWESKLGGCPYLLNKKDYPLDKYGEPMMFLAQINFEEMPPLEGFTDKGLLQFYITNTEDYGYDETCRIIYYELYEKNEEILLSENPFQKVIEENLPFSHECKIIFKSSEMAVTDYEEAFEEMIEEIDDEDENEFYEAFSSGASRIGGYPVFVQNPVEAYESGSKPVLLLQLDEDPIADIMFGDCGNCQFFISEDDLRKKDFSDIVYDWACC